MLAGQRFTAGDDHPHRQDFILRGKELRQLAAVARREAEDVDPMRTNQAADFFRVPLPLRPQHHLRTAEQRHQQTFGGGVEVDRIEMQFTVVRAHAEAFDHGPAVHGNFAVGDHHAFWFAGRARGVNQVGLMLRQADKRQLAGRVVGQSRAVVFQTPARHV